MNIVFDFRPALIRSTGVGTYVHNLVKALCETYPTDTYKVFSASWKDRVDLSRAPAGAVVTDRKIPVQVLDWAWHRWRYPGVERFVGPVDIAHSPSPMLLPCRSGRTVVTVHDCYFMRHPEDVFGPVRRDYVPLARRAAAEADAVVVVSRTTAAEVQELFGVPEDKIWVTPLGVAPGFFDADAGAAAGWLAAQGIDRPFLLFVGRRETRKDLGTLLSAFGELIGRGEDLQLVLAGPDAPGWEETWAAVPPRVRALTLLIPHQPPERIASLYAAAAILVMPSRWEGFGLTGLEAMAAGTPVVASEVGSLPEILGDAAAFAAPGDPVAMAEQCRSILGDAAVSEELRQRGRARASAYRWQNTARLTRQLYAHLGSA